MNLDDLMETVQDAIAEAIADAQQASGTGFVKVTLWTDGTATVARTVSRERGASEYYSRVPHPLTVWERLVGDLQMDQEDWTDDTASEWAVMAVRDEGIREKVGEWLEAGNLTEQVTQ